MNRDPCLILIVEDDADVRETLAEVLEDEGYHTARAEHGRAALDLLRSPKGARPGIVLLDIMMPVMNGIEFRAEQLRDPELADIPVIVLSAHTSLDDLAIELRASDALRKPVSLEALLDAVERVTAAEQSVATEAHPHHP